MAAPGSKSEGAWGVQGAQEALEQKKRVQWQIQEGLGVLGVLGAQGAQRKMEAQVALGGLGVFEGPQEGAQIYDWGQHPEEVEVKLEALDCLSLWTV